MTFSDTTLGASTLERAMAVGAEMVVRVNCPACAAPSVTHAFSSDPGVFEVVSRSGDEVTLRGVAPGAAELRVEVANVTDRVTVLVDAIADASVRLEPWPDWSPLPTSLWETGFAMLAGSDIEARAFPRDDNGERLTGFGAITWASAGGATVEAVAEQRADIVRVTALADAEPEITLTPSAGPAQSIGVVTAADVASLELAVMGEGAPTIIQDAETLAMDPNDSIIVHLVARDAAGTFIAGPGETLATLEMSETLAGRLTDITETLLNAPDADPEEIEAFRRTFERGFLLAGTGSMGEGDLTFTWAGQTLTVRVALYGAD